MLIRSSSSSSKILSPEHAARWVRSFQKDGDKIVFTNGCFDILHSGHVKYIEQARKLGDGLIVALNADASVKRLKGHQRPIVPLKDRAKVVASLECVDVVTWFTADTPERLIKKLMPMILVKGGDWAEDSIVGADFVRTYGGEVRSLSFVSGKSTTNIIQKVQSV